jgi:hypothetical protein
MDFKEAYDRINNEMLEIAAAQQVKSPANFKDKFLAKILRSMKMLPLEYC